MFKICMKNYFRSLKYVFVVLGIMFLAFLIGATFFMKKTSADFSYMIEQISQAAQSTGAANVGAGFFETLGNCGELVLSVLGSILEELLNVVAGVVLFFGIQYIGIYIANVVVFLFERYDINHDNIFKICLEQLCRSILLFCVFAIISSVFIWVDSTVGLILLCLYPIAYCFVALLSAWLTAGKKKRPKWTESVTFKNMLLLLVSNILQILFSIAIAILAFYVLDVVAAIVVVIALLVIAMATTNLNAYAFIYNIERVELITTFTGIRFNPLHAKPDNIRIEDIAHSLPLICRGNGQVKSFFSVAQHCINCANEAEGLGYSKRVQLACLLHDAAECYLSDVPRPLKISMPQYHDYEGRLLSMIYKKFLGSDITSGENKLVREIDDVMLYYDLHSLLQLQGGDKPALHTELSYDFVPFDEVEALYMKKFNELVG